MQKPGVRNRVARALSNGGETGCKILLLRQDDFQRGRAPEPESRAFVFKCSAKLLTRPRSLLDRAREAYERGGECVDVCVDRGSSLCSDEVRFDTCMNSLVVGAARCSILER